MTDPAFPADVHRIGERTRERLVAGPACPALAAHGLIGAGVSDAARGFRFVRARPPFGVVLATLAGRGAAALDGRWRALAPGDVLLLPPGGAHAYRAEGRWRVAWVVYAAERWPHAPRADVVRAPMAGLAHAIEALADEAGGDDRGPQVHLAAAVAALSGRVARARGADAGLRAALAAVAAHPERPWTLWSLARIAGVGIETLRRRCLAETGRSPLREVARLRLDAAAGLLAAHGLPVAEAGARVGYRDAFAFSTAFRRAFGVPPSRVRRG